MKKSRAMALFLSAVMAFPTMPTMMINAEEVQVQDASDENGGETAAQHLSYEGYTEVWSEDFNGTSLNTDDWNVELHEAGWVNQEWQEYVNSGDNIKVEDGKLKLIPQQIETSVPARGQILANNDFASATDGWGITIANWGGDFHADASAAAVTNGVKFTINDVGDEAWNVQLKQGIKLYAGKKYTVKYTVTSSIDRKIDSGIQHNGGAASDGGDDSGNYDGYDGGEGKTSVTAGTPKNIEYSFTSSKNDDFVNLYVSLGKIDSALAAHEVTISNVSIVEAESGEVTYGSNLFNNADFSDGKTSWNVNNVEGNDAVVSENGLVYTIKDIGENDYSVQLTQTYNLDKNKKYKASFKIESSVERTIVYGMQQSDYKKWYGGAGDVVIPAGEEVEKTFDIDPSIKELTTDDIFYLSMGKTSASETSDEHTIRISDLKLVEVIEPTSEPTYKYTSGRINTQDKHTFKYGLFECVAKVPEGKGYLPAFWLMANDESLYGQWPRCGEIDCMEVMGHETDKLYGTIHYGASVDMHGQQQGTFKGTDFAAGYHKFQCEWEPGKITWYVDGIKYYDTSEWYTRAAETEDNATYPAPFDQDFYIILNLAVGGSWVGYPDETTTYGADSAFEIDSVKVWQKESYNEEVEAPTKEVVKIPEPDVDGNYIKNGNFAEDEKITFADNEKETGWVFKTALGGEATANIVSGNGIDIDITKAGTVDYSVQLYQAEVPLEKGATYQIKFDASADAPRTMNVDVKLPNSGYAMCMPTQNPDLTTEKQTFTYEFKMEKATDLNGRLEFNMGNAGTDNIHISNVSLVKVGDSDPEVVKKTMRADGNYIYNGSFTQGAKYLGYWELSPESAACKVTSIEDGRRLEIPAGTKLDLGQSELGFNSGVQYLFSVEVDSATGNEIIPVSIGGKQYQIKVDTVGKKVYSITIPSSVVFSNHDVLLKVDNSASASNLYIDNVRLVEDSIIKNGNFNGGTTAFSTFKNAPADFSFVVDSITEDNAADFTINNTGTADWNIQLIQYIKLEKGKSYRLSYDAKSSINRKIFAQIQHDPDNHMNVDGTAGDYYNYAGTSPVELTNEFQTFTTDFTMTRETNEYAKFNICLGAVEDVQITDQHRVVIDNIKVEEIEGGAPTPGGEEATPVIEVQSIPNYTYTGKAIKPAVKVTQGGETLVEGKDYKVTVKNNVNANKDGLLVINSGLVVSENGISTPDYNKDLPYVEITGAGNFEEKLKVNFNILPASIKKTGVITTNDCLAFNDKKDTAVAFTVTVDGKKLAVNKDYTAKVVAADEVHDASDAPVANGTEMTGNKIPKGYTGTFDIVVEGTKNYTGKIKKTIEVSKKISLNAASIKIDPVAATGLRITDADVAKAIKYVKVKGKTLEYGKDYTVNFNGAVTAGKYTFTITGKGDYAGTKSATVQIKGIAMSKTKAVISYNSLVYDGTAKGLNNLKVTYTTKVGGKSETVTLVNGKDYIATTNGTDVNVGTAKISIRGIGKYEGTIAKTYKITALTYKADDTNFAYTKKLADQTYLGNGIAITPDVNITYKGEKLVNGKDYKLSYSGNKTVGAGKKVTVTFMKNFKGKITDITFDVVAGSLATATATAADVVYVDKADKYMSVPVVYAANGKKLKAKTDYSNVYEYSVVSRNGLGEIISTNALKKGDKPAVGSEIAVTVKGDGKNISADSTVTAYYKIVGMNIAKTAAKVTKTYKFISKNTPVTIKASDIEVTVGSGKNKKTLTPGVDYEIVEGSYKNNAKVGTASVEIRGLGANYGGTKKVTFKIVKTGLFTRK